MEASRGTSKNLFQRKKENLAAFKDSPILPVLSCLEKTLKDSKKSYKDKVASVVSVCHTVTNFMIIRPLSADITDKVIEFIYYNAAKLVLNCRWLKVDNVTKNYIGTTLKKCLDHLQKINLVGSSRFVISLINLVGDPWGSETLIKIMNDESLQENEVIDFFNRETLILLGLRVQSLLEAKSEDLALKLVSFIIQSCGLSINDFIRLFIRIITNVINHIEELHHKKNETKIRDVEKKLCNIFLVMFNMFRGYKGISRECVLTAFSLDPTNEIFELIRFCNQRDFPDSTENNLYGNLDEKPFTRALGAITPDTGRYLIESVNYDPFSAQSDIIDECKELQISMDFTHDLISAISYPRYKRLSWVYDWPKLRENCEKYITSGVNVRNPTKELKYLVIDFNQFLEAIN